MFRPTAVLHCLVAWFTKEYEPYRLQNGWTDFVVIFKKSSNWPSGCAVHFGSDRINVKSNFGQKTGLTGYKESSYKIVISKATYSAPIILSTKTLQR